MKIAPGPVPGSARAGPKAAWPLGAVPAFTQGRAEPGASVPPWGRGCLSADHMRAQSGAAVLLARSGSGEGAGGEGPPARRRRGGVRGPKRSPPARPAGRGAFAAEGFGNRQGSRIRPAGR